MPPSFESQIATSRVDVSRGTQTPLPLYQPALHERDNLGEIGCTIALNLTGSTIASTVFDEAIMQFPGSFVTETEGACRGFFLAHLDLFGGQPYGLDPGPPQRSML